MATLFILAIYAAGVGLALLVRLTMVRGPKKKRERELQRRLARLGRDEWDELFDIASMLEDDRFLNDVGL